MSLVERFALDEKARARMEEFGVATPWQAYVQVRLDYYEAMLADATVIRDNQWPHNVGLLGEARRSDCQGDLATMSHCEQVQHVLAILELAAGMNVVAVATPFTQERLHDSRLLAEELIVDDPAEVTAVVHQIIESKRHM